MSRQVPNQIVFGFLLEHRVGFLGDESSIEVVGVDSHVVVGLEMLLARLVGYVIADASLAAAIVEDGHYESRVVQPGLVGVPVPVAGEDCVAIVTCAPAEVVRTDDTVLGLALIDCDIVLENNTWCLPMGWMV